MEGSISCRFGQMMGRSVCLDIRDPLPSETLDRLAAEVFDWLHHVEELFDPVCEHSEVNLMDRGLIRPSEAGPLVREVRTACARLHQRTDGYFDVRVTGRLDPSRYVRGWALQQASALLNRGGAGNHCLRVGGDIKVSGRPAEDRAWRVAVQDPCRPGGISWIETATDLAVATANNSRHGDRTRNPLTRRNASGITTVTLAGPELGDAAAYATAAVAMGPAALGWLPELQDHAYLAVDDHGQCLHGGGRCLTLAA